LAAFHKPLDHDLLARDLFLAFRDVTVSLREMPALLFLVRHWFGSRSAATAAMQSGCHSAG